VTLDSHIHLYRCMWKPCVIVAQGMIVQSKNGELKMGKIKISKRQDTSEVSLSEHLMDFLEYVSDTYSIGNKPIEVDKTRLHAQLLGIFSRCDLSIVSDSTSTETEVASASAHNQAADDYLRVSHSSIPTPMLLKPTVTGKELVSFVLVPDTTRIGVGQVKPFIGKFWKRLAKKMDSQGDLIVERLASRMLGTDIGNKARQNAADEKETEIKNAAIIRGYLKMSAGAWQESYDAAQESGDDRLIALADLVQRKRDEMAQA
jgi:hypothetical protein